MVSLSAKSSINLLNLKANVRVKIVLCVLNGLVLCLLTKMANAFALALSLVLPLNQVECSTLTLTIFALSQVSTEILRSF